MDATTTQRPAQIGPGDRVDMHAGCYRNGTVIAVYGDFAWVDWGHCRDGCSPASHQLATLRRRRQ